MFVYVLAVPSMSSFVEQQRPDTDSSQRCSGCETGRQCLWDTRASCVQQGKLGSEVEKTAGGHREGSGASLCRPGAAVEGQATVR